MSFATQLRRRGPLLPTVLVLGVLVAAFLVFTEIWTTRLWFDSTGYSQVFSTLLLTQVILFLSFSLLMALIVGGNIWLAYRLRPPTRRSGQSAVLDRYRDLMEANPWRTILIPTLIFRLPGRHPGVGSTALVPGLVESDHLRQP